MAGWIDYQADGSSAVGEVEGESGDDCSAEVLGFLAAGLDVGHLHVDHAVESADLAVRTAQRPDARATHRDLRCLIGACDRIELPVEQLAIEVLGLGDILCRDIEPGDAPRSDIWRGFLWVAAWSGPVTRDRAKVIARIALRIAVLLGQVVSCEKSQNICNSNANIL